jgi:hypothetical protein
MDAALNHDDSYIFASPTAGDGVVAGTGLTALDRIYAQGHSRPLEALGGSCGNVLMSLAMLGHPVAPVIALGDDAHGDYLVDQFRRAGCETRFVFRKSDRSSPVIVEHVDPHRAHHWFSFTCPETFAALPRWRPIDEEEVRSARGTLEHASVFYVDRLSPAIVTAMEPLRPDCMTADICSRPGAGCQTPPSKTTTLGAQSSTPTGPSIRLLLPSSYPEP